jgi:predicted nucleic acid-binding protein
LAAAGLAAFFCMTCALSGCCGAHYTQTAQVVIWICRDTIGTDQPSHSVEATDAIIAATAEHHGLELATHNVKRLPMFPRLRPAY